MYANVNLTPKFKQNYILISGIKDGTYPAYHTGMEFKVYIRGDSLLVLAVLVKYKYKA